MPNSLRYWLDDVSIKTQKYQSFDPVKKLCIRVTASDGVTYVHRCGFDSWTATCLLLTQLSHMTRQQLADQGSASAPQMRAVGDQSARRKSRQRCSATSRRRLLSALEPCWLTE